MCSASRLCKRVAIRDRGWQVIIGQAITAPLKADSFRDRKGRAAGTSIAYRPPSREQEKTSFWKKAGKVIWSLSARKCCGEEGREYRRHPSVSNGSRDVGDGTTVSRRILGLTNALIWAAPDMQCGRVWRFDRWRISAMQQALHRSVWCRVGLL
jgi:hypothetical protein